MSQRMAFNLPAARDRECAMLDAIGRMARGEVRASNVEDDGELRQMAYLVGSPATGSVGG